MLSFQYLLFAIFHPELTLLVNDVIEHLEVRHQLDAPLGNYSHNGWILHLKFALFNFEFRKGLHIL